MRTGGRALQKLQRTQDFGQSGQRKPNVGIGQVDNVGGRAQRAVRMKSRCRRVLESSSRGRQ
jgi:hypothetical protein